MLSIVAGSRNDGHGQHLIPRMQVFINGLADQSKRFGREVELVLVEWNPPADAAPLTEVLTSPKVDGFNVRVITVPEKLHSRLAAADRLLFFQMIAKNVGIRRATGDSVLATNIDILLSDELFLDCTGELRNRCLYRTDRADIPFDPAVTVDPVRLRASEPVRINRRNGIFYPGGGSHPHARGARDLTRAFFQDPIGFVRRATFWSARSGPPSLRRYRRAFMEILVLPRLHFNACGDFTLMRRRSWEELRGYPEWEMYSWNLDSLLLYQAAVAGFDFIDFEGHAAFHLEHTAGWSLESQAELFGRLQRQAIPVLTDVGLLDVASLLWKSRPAATWRLNLPGWGMLDEDLREVRLPTATHAISDSQASLKRNPE